MTRRVKYHKPLRILAETNGLSLSTLEYRLKSGIELKEALSIPTRSREVTRKDLLECNHLTFSQACDFLGITSRKLIRLSKMYDVYFRHTSYTQDNESKVIMWCALHSPILRLKSMAKFVSNQLGFSITENQLRYRFFLFGFSLKLVKKEREKHKQLMFDLLWS